MLATTATAATVIASQAVISGAFSVTRQAIQLGYAPRMETLHTSDKAAGQIYIPFINWSLLIGVIALVIGFQSSSNLAAAYGIAVTGTMAIDTILVFVVARVLWRWHWAATAVGMVFFLIVDLAFLGANIPKIIHGGWFPLGNGFFSILLHFGFKDNPDVPKALALCKPLGPELNMLETSFFFSRETLIATQLPGMAQWRKNLFIGMARNASSAMGFFKIPTNRVIELGAQIEL